MRKSQMEILGIAIVVVLATLGLLFIVSYSITKPKTIKQEFTTSATVENLLTTLMATTTECNGLDYADVLKGCATGTVECGISKSACQYANEIATAILENSLKVWGKSYYFKAFETDEKIVISDGECVDNTNGACKVIPGKCKGSREFGYRILPADGPKKIIFYICS